MIVFAQQKSGAFCSAPTDPQTTELGEVYNTNWASIRSSRYNGQYYLLLIARSAKSNIQQRFRLVREKVRDVCDRREKVEVLERVKELVV